MTTAAPPATTDALFQWIEEREREHCSSFKSSWGRVLDAGTGRHSLTWLLRGNATPDRITDVVAVTGETSLANDLTAIFANGESPRLTVRVGNWQDAAFLAHEQAFDVIIADYLVGAMEGFAPYYQDEICARLEKLLTPGGRIYLVGLQPLSESQAPGNGSNDLESLDTGKLIQEVARTRDACLLLAGRRVYREFPIEWSQRQLEKAGMVVTDSVRLVNVYTRSGLTRQLAVGRQYVPLLPDTELRDHLVQALDRLDQRMEETFGAANVAHDEQRKICFGSDYVVAARKAMMAPTGAGEAKGVVVPHVP